MDWILPAYIIGLVLLSNNSSRFENTEPLKRAWAWLAAALILMAVLTVSQLGVDRNSSMAKLAIWTTALNWLFIGISAAQLPSLFKAGGDSADDQ